MEFFRGRHTDKDLLDLYKALLVPRLIEEKMLVLLRQGKISKWFSGYGQEAISVGMTEALDKNDHILPMHRNLGVFTSRNVSLERLFAQFQGKMSGFTKGRDRSFHFGSQEHNIVGMISHLGSQMGVADGLALAEKLKNSGKISAVITGDGGASEGDFHEAINVAAVWDLPVLFVVENNGYGLSTPSHQQFRFNQFIDKGPGYGIVAHQVDGNNILAVHDKVAELAEYIRNEQKPVLLECITFRMRGHEEASGTKYIPNELMDKWAQWDPVNHYQTFLLKEDILDEKSDKEIRESIKAEINEAWEESDSEEMIAFDVNREVSDVFREFNSSITEPSGEKVEKRFIDAVNDSLDLALEKHENLILMGQDIADYGGVFKATEGLLEKYGAERVRNTPLCEAAILGSALGLSVAGYKSMVEMQFADFVSEGFNQIVNNLAKVHWRWGVPADVVVRMPTGAGVNAGPFHSQSNEAWFTNTPGLKVVYPSNTYDAKGLLLAAFEDPNPIMFFEHKALYRSDKDVIPSDYYTLEIGKANVVQEGSDMSIITYGMGVHWAMNYNKDNPEISIDIIDLRTLIPLDEEVIFESVRKTGRVLVLHEDTLTGGIGGEIAARINENCFESLDAPVKRLGSLDTPVPFAAELEKGFLANSRLDETIQELLNY